jgi:hypothetical protein
MVHLDWFHYHFSVYAILIVRATIHDTNCLTSCYNCPFQIKNVAQEYCIKRYSVCPNNVRFVLSVSYVFKMFSNNITAIDLISYWVKR